MISEWPPLPPVQTGIRGLCPRCGQGHLFDGFLKLRAKCEECELDYSFAEPADGPAFFAMCFTCVPAMALASWVEISFQPVFWVHLLTTLPLVLLFSILPLRPLKGWLVNSQFFFKAAEGQIDMDYRRPEVAKTPTANPLGP